MEDAKAAPQVVVAKVLEETESPAGTRGSNLFSLLEPDAVQLKAAATCLFCWSLAQLFTLHGFLGCIASAVVIFYAEGSPLGTAHAARFTHPLAIATAIFSAGALAATVIVSLAIIPSVPVDAMMQACQDAQESQGPWTKGVEGFQFPKPPMHHDGFQGDMVYPPHHGQPVQVLDFVMNMEPETDKMMYVEPNDEMMYAYAVDAVERGAEPMHHEAHHEHGEYKSMQEHHEAHHEERPSEPEPEVPGGRRPVPMTPPVMSRSASGGWGARRLQEIAIDNCDEMVEYMSSYLPVVLLANMLVQGGLLFSAMSVAKRAGLLLLKARQLGAAAL